MLRRLCGVGTALFILAVLSGHAQQYQWSGAGADDSWGTAGNWTNNAVPPLVYTGAIVFTTTDLGGTNTLETGRTVAGAIGSLTRGLRYNIGAANTNLAHTTDLGGNTLALNGGTLQVGYDTNNSVVTIQNGTLQFGGVTQADVYVGVAALPISTSWQTGNVLRVTAAIDATNLQSISVARNSYGNGPAAHGRLDLSGAAIRSGADADALRLNGDLSVGYTPAGAPGLPRYNEGFVLLPPSLKKLDVRDLRLGSGPSSYGTLDFGSGSALTNLTVRGNFGLSDNSGQGFVLNFPSNVVFTVGTNNGLSTMRIGFFTQTGAGVQNNTTGSLALIKGQFIGRLGELTVGYNESGNVGVQTAVLDLSDTAVQIGNESNKVQLTTLGIGTRLFPNGIGGGQATGTLKLPSNVTEIVAGNLYLGHGYNGLGYLDITSNSALHTLTVTNALSIGGGFGGFIGYDNGGTFREYLPAGVTLNVGLPSSRALMYIGRRAVDVGFTNNGAGHLVVSNGTLSAYLSSLIVGINTDDPLGSAKSIGTLDLRYATVSAFDVLGDVAIGTQAGAAVSTGTTGNKGGNGYLYLPACSANVASNLFVGDTNATSLGLLDLRGAVVTVGTKVDIEPTGIVSNHLAGASGGLDLTFADTNRFLVDANARIRLSFEANPSDLKVIYWGLRMAGDQRVYFQTLANDSRLTWSTGGLSVKNAARVGIYYDNAIDKTYVGMPKLASGTIVGIH